MSRRFGSIACLALPVYLLLLSSVGSVVWAGLHEGGTLLLHVAREVAYTTDATSYCGASGLASCGEAVAEAPASPDSIVVCFVVAAFPETATPALTGVTFGLQYGDEDVSIVAHGSCGEFELATPSWPANGSGTAVTWLTPQAETLREVYWFAAYANGPSVLALAPHPTQGAYFADGSIPSVLDPVGGLGSLGFGVEGDELCPGELEEGGEDGEGARLLPLAIGPDRIDPRVGCWTLLVLGEMAGGEVIDEVVLRSERQDVQATYVEQTTAESRLFTYEGLEDGEEWRAVALARGREVYEKRLEKVQVVDPPHADIWQGFVDLVPEAGVLVYEPGARSRSYSEVPVSRPQLAKLFEFLGIREFRKTKAMEGETPRENSPVPTLWRNYRAYFDDHHGPWAMRELLIGQPGVEKVNAPIAFKSYSSNPCDWDVTEERYEEGSLWWLKHRVETGWSSTGANYAWCGGTGSGQAIGIIDTPFRDHRDIDYASGYDIGIPPFESHGLACAGMAAARENGRDVVGIAYDADIYPLEVPDSPTGFDIAAALFWGVENLPSGAVISLSRAAWVGIDELRAAVEAAYLDGIPMFVIRHEHTSYPGLWDQSSPEGWVLSVDGSDKSGDAFGAGAADILAPTEDLSVLTSFDGLWDNYTNLTGSLAVPQVAAAAALAIGCGAIPSIPSQVYSEILGSATDNVLNVSKLVGIVGVNDVANLTATPGIWEVRLEWDLTNSEGVYGFAIESSPSCWGPFQTEIDIIHVGDPLYTVDGIHYVVELPTLYERSYAFQLVAIATGGETVRYHVESAPESAVPVTPGAAPVVSLTFPGDTEAELRWTGDPPGTNAATHYWIYRGVHGSMADCEETELGSTLPWWSPNLPSPGWTSWMWAGVWSGRKIGASHSGCRTWT